MPQSTDKKIFFYIILFFLLVTINNKKIINSNIFEIKSINLIGYKFLDEKKLLKELDQYTFNNIFNLKKELIENLIYENDMVENIDVFKNYPSELIINIKKTKFVANININGTDYFIGANKKFIKSENNDPNLPSVFGKPTAEEFIKLHENIINSSLKFKDLKYLYFFPSKRWDLEFKNGNILKLPLITSSNIFETYYKISQSEHFKEKNVFDMRINDQLIINEL
ncbi:POTRA domain-containing protein, FtsQ-like,Cell division protein FtsQ [alpha proteobacterium HIMB5]|nr:POTRA domain-containing protein, FtsQ-like,Cell division protein FtsQ [alpha proteobacterium HIMB5]